VPSNYYVEGGMTTLTAILWLAEFKASVKFGEGECSVDSVCQTHPKCIISATAKGSPGAAFVTAVLTAALQHDAHTKGAP
jgi:hypothetical protein